MEIETQVEGGGKLAKASLSVMFDQRLICFSPK